MNLRDLVLLACAAAALLLAARIVVLMGWRRPVLARTLGANYTEMERCRDADMNMVRYANYSPFDDSPFRRVQIRAEYDWAGARYREDVSVFVWKGSRPERSEVLWLDPRRPTNVTAVGPGFWTMGLLLIGLLAFAATRLPF